jgi:hypothetical protein
MIEPRAANARLRRCEERCDEAIHAAAAPYDMDRFASLARTVRESDKKVPRCNRK